MAKKLNNPTTGSTEEQPIKGTELDEGKEKEKKEVTLPEKFKTTEELVKAYNELEQHLGKRDETNDQMRERLAKLEGILETQKKVERKLPEITKEERDAMTARFKEDFQKDPLIAWRNMNAPLYNDIRVANERAEKVERELADIKQKEKGREMRELAAKARGTGDKAKLFDEMIPQIQDELKNNKVWEGFDNPPEAVFYHLLGKSTKNLARVDDADREAFVEGSSPVSEEDKSDDALRKKMIQKIKNTRGVAHLR